MKPAYVYLAPLIYMLKGKTLTKEKVLHLLAAKDPEDLKAAIRGTWLEEVLPRLKEFTPEAVEREALRYLYERVLRLVGSFKSTEIKTIAEIYERMLIIRDVSVIIKSAMLKTLEESLDYVVLREHPKIKELVSVIKTQGLEKASSVFKGKVLEQAINDAVNLFKETKTAEVIDLVLESAVCGEVVKFVERKAIADAAIMLRNIICPRVDSLAIVVAARTVLLERKKVDFPACHKEWVQAINQCKTPEEVVATLRRIPLGEGAPDNVWEALAMVLTKGKRMQRKAAEAALLSYPFSILPAVAILFLYRLDAADVASIFSGKAAGLGPGDIARELSFEI